jgi:hypothetical protein
MSEWDIQFLKRKKLLLDMRYLTSLPFSNRAGSPLTIVKTFLLLSSNMLSEEPEEKLLHIKLKLLTTRYQPFLNSLTMKQQP